MEHEEELDIYGDTGIESRNTGIGLWLKVIYFILPFWGVFWLFLLWNGASGWLDRGYWSQLEKAANTTYPTTNYLKQAKDKKSE